MKSNLDKKQKILLVLVVLAFIFITWQLYDMFGSKFKPKVTAVSVPSAQSQSFERKGKVTKPIVLLSPMQKKSVIKENKTGNATIKSLQNSKLEPKVISHKEDATVVNLDNNSKKNAKQQAVLSKNDSSSVHNTNSGGNNVRKIDAPKNQSFMDKILSKIGIRVKKTSATTVNTASAVQQKAITVAQSKPAVDEVKPDTKDEATSVPATANVALTPTKKTKTFATNNEQKATQSVNGNKKANHHQSVVKGKAVDGSNIKQLLVTLQQAQANEEQQKEKNGNANQKPVVEVHPVSNNSFAVQKSVPKSTLVPVNLTIPAKPVQQVPAVSVNSAPKPIQQEPLIIISNKKPKTTITQEQAPAAVHGIQEAATAVTKKPSAIQKGKPDYYVLQLMSGTNVQDMIDFINKNKLGAKARYIKLKNRYILVYGNYGRSAEARVAMQNLPQAIKNRKPWIKPMHDAAPAISQ